MQSIHGLPLIQTKVMIPAMRDRMVHRFHLLDQIDQGINQGFILISSPPGYGKTTLVADWSHRCSTPVAWLTLDEQDNDLLVLNRYLENIRKKLFSEVNSNALDILPVRNADDQFHYLLVTIINECSKVDTDLTIILDDYQVIHNPIIHEGFIFLLEHFPEHLRFILASRTDPPFPLARLQAKHRVLKLSSVDLKFTEVEAEEFLNQTNHLLLTQAEVEKCYQRTEGWITGLQLAALTVDGPTRNMLPTSSPSLTLEYMGEEVIYLQTPEIQDFLLRTSILDNLSGPLCKYILNTNGDSPQSQDLLHSLYHANLFLTALDTQEHWFRYHPLFGETLKHLLLQKYPEEIPGLYKRASEWCDQNGLYEEALKYASGSNDSELLLSYLKKYAIEAFKNGNILDYSTWLNNPVYFHF